MIVDGEKRRWDEGEEGDLYRLFEGQETYKLASSISHSQIGHLIPFAAVGCSQESKIAGEIHGAASGCGGDTF